MNAAPRQYAGPPPKSWRRSVLETEGTLNVNLTVRDHRAALPGVGSGLRLAEKRRAEVPYGRRKMDGIELIASVEAKREIIAAAGADLTPAATSAAPAPHVWSSSRPTEPTTAEATRPARTAGAALRGCFLRLLPEG